MASFQSLTHTGSTNVTIAEVDAHIHLFANFFATFQTLVELKQQSLAADG